MDDENIVSEIPAVPPENMEIKPEDTGAVVPAPVANATPPQPAPSPVAEPEAASVVPEMTPQSSAPAPPVQTSGADLNSLRQKANAQRTARREIRLQKFYLSRVRNKIFQTKMFAICCMWAKALQPIIFLN